LHHGTGLPAKLRFFGEKRAAKASAADAERATALKLSLKAKFFQEKLAFIRFLMIVCLSYKVNSFCIIL
jgi:hypothetical protein